MKAISLWQPWASLIALGEKKIETRSWTTAHRGPLAIHASQKMTREMKLLCEREPFASALDRVFAVGDELPLGVIVAVCELSYVDRIMPKRPSDRGIMLSAGTGVAYEIYEPEISFGDYTPGRYAWVLEDVRRLQAPVVCRGAQGIFELPSDVLAQIERNPR